MKSGFKMALRLLVGLSAVPAIVAAGEPLVTSALVTRPGTIEGVESWTIETVLPRGGLQALAAHPARPQFVTGGSDSVVRIWNSATFAGHTNWVYSLRCGSDPFTVASCSRDRTIRVWDLKTATQLRMHRGHAGQIDTLDWSRDGGTLATGSTWDGTIRLWKAASLAAGPVLLPLPDGPIAISPEGHVQTAGDASGQIAVIVQTSEGQQTYRPNEFGRRFAWTNLSDKVRWPAP